MNHRANSPGQRLLAVLGAWAAVLALVGLGACSGDDGGPAADPGQTGSTSIPAGSPVRLEVPAGWFLSSDGLTAAAAEADLSADLPHGPTVRAVLGAESPDSVGAFERALEATATVEAGPDRVEVDGAPGLAVTFRRSVASDGGEPVDVVVRFIAVTASSGESVVFEVWAPRAQWKDLASTLEAVPGLA